MSDGYAKLAHAVLTADPSEEEAGGLKSSYETWIVVKGHDRHGARVAVRKPLNVPVLAATGRASELTKLAKREAMKDMHHELARRLIARAGLNCVQGQRVYEQAQRTLAARQGYKLAEPLRGAP